jgi:CheY-like chemotaxis protein
MKVSCQRILCADTNPYFRQFVSRFLTDSGNEVAEASTASEVLALIRERPDHYDLLIVAGWLPDMDSAELLPALRAIPYAGRIVITLPKLSPDQRTKYESLGTSSFLLTPVSYSDILRVVNPLAADARNESGA